MTRKVSVITSTHNRADLLQKTIASVLNQSFTDFEYIIVDDASTDDTKRVVSSFNDDRIRYICLDTNSGHDSLPKNVAIKEALGEYITFLDDDDQYRPDALKVLVKYLETGADVAYGDYLIEEKGKMKPGWSEDFNAPLLSKMNYISMSTAIVKREALLAVGGFDENIPKFKDWNVWIRLQKNGNRFLHIPIIVTEVFPQKTSVTETYKVEYDDEGHYKATYFNPADCEIWATKTSLGEKKPLKVAVFTLCKDRIEYTKRMYDSMNKLAGYPFEWFVIDQGSIDGTIEFLKDKPNVLRNDKNVGIAKGWNQAISFIKSKGEFDVVIKLDNDAEMMTQDWLKTMIEIFDRNMNLVLSPYVEGLEDSPGGVLRARTQGGASPYVLIHDKVMGMVPFLGGICWAAPMKLYKDFEFPEETFYAGNKDYMISQYARKIGYTCFYLEEVRVWHIDGTVGQKKKYADYFEQSQLEKITKYAS